MISPVSFAIIAILLLKGCDKYDLILLPFISTIITIKNYCQFTTNIQNTL